MEGSNVRIIFSNNLNRLAKEKGVTQADIVCALNCSSSTVSDYFSGKKYPRPDKMQKIADLLGVYISDLTSEKEEPTVCNDKPLNPKAKYLMNLIDSMNDEELDALERIVDSVIQLRGK
ncbi:helix-turn-helix domain-containing protein [Yeguia hominis]|uniref:Helix-turn-helix transcriptional regulator n=1 Tax=Yeguia hominis TaxID=2763662 RepID=A0A926DB09_9FIRM|nr:helix-turn-helix transcriptional regulator [Yeguia hominis]MBC8534582.1 helix-turn-helix transcriptional regulator [Yeguia hominis]